MFTQPDDSYHGLVYTEHFGARRLSSAAAAASISARLGAVLSPLNAFLLLQGIETVALRVERHVENGRRVAEFLRADPRVESVNYAGFRGQPLSCAGAEIPGRTGLFAADFRDRAAACRPACASTMRSSCSSGWSISATPNRSPAIRPRPRIGRCRPQSNWRPASAREASASASASSTSTTSWRISTRRSRPRVRRPRREMPHCPAIRCRPPSMPCSRPRAERGRSTDGSRRSLEEALDAVAGRSGHPAPRHAARFARELEAFDFAQPRPLEEVLRWTHRAHAARHRADGESALLRPVQSRADVSRRSAPTGSPACSIRSWRARPPRRCRWRSRAT